MARNTETCISPDDASVRISQIMNDADEGSPRNPSNYNKPIYRVKSRYYAFVLYPDNEYHMQFLHYIEAESIYDFIYIKHRGHEIEDGVRAPCDGVFDSDLDEPVTTKDHFHLVVDFGCKRGFKSVLNLGGLYYINFVAPVNNLDSMLLYLLHLSDEAIKQHKEVYDISECVSCGRFLIDRLQRLLLLRDAKKGSSNYNPVCELLDIIEHSNTMTDFFVLVSARPDLDSWVVKHQLLVRECLRENNLIGGKLK